MELLLLLAAAAFLLRRRGVRPAVAGRSERAADSSSDPQRLVAQYEPACAEPVPRDGLPSPLPR